MRVQSLAWEVWIDGPVVLKAVMRPSGARTYHVFLETCAPVGCGERRLHITEAE